MIHKLLAAITALIATLWTHPGNIPIVSSQATPTTSAAVEIVAQNLEIPWELAFLPSGDALITERPGRLQLLDKSHQLTQLAQILEVKHIGEGGLLGVAVDPEYSTNQYIYLYYTYHSENNRTLNRVVRYKLSDNKISDPTTLVDVIPGSANHNGGRLKFSPDGYLYITTGDAQNPSLSQNKNSLAGKILRWKNNEVEVYSSGHRNPQGLAWDSSGQLWATEHGPSAHDEINKIVAGQNYGWPEITGNQRGLDMVPPVAQSGNSTWAPAGMTYLDGTLYFAGLRGQSLFSTSVNSSAVTEHFKNEFGRLRDVVLGPDGMLYLLTSNRDGRGQPQAGDDKILKVSPP